MNIVSTSYNLEKYCKDLGLSDSYMIKLLQTIIDKNTYFLLDLLYTI